MVVSIRTVSYTHRVYAKNEGSAAAPTAGLHFTPELLEKVKEKGVNIAHVTLPVSYTHLDVYKRQALSLLEIFTQREGAVRPFPG